ncbi:MAG: AAA family ATPase, partial [Parvularculaceae bacterium]
MRIRHIGLTDFRSYTQLELPLSGKPVVLTGQNGAGKTNLLEAISMFSAGRGMRHARLNEVVRQDGPGGWAVRMQLAAGDDLALHNDLGVGVHAGSDKRLVRIDGAPAKPGDLLDYLNFLWLTPAQDRLFMDSPSERRKFLDRMVLAHDKTHGRQVRDYENAMRQRQKLFEQGQFDEAWLSGLEARMAQTGVAIAAARREMAGRLAAGIERIAQSVFPVAEISLDGALEQALGDQSAGAAEEAFEARLKAGRR